MERAREWNSQAGRFLTESRLNLPYTAAYANISRLPTLRGKSWALCAKKGGTAERFFRPFDERRKRCFFI